MADLTMTGKELMEAVPGLQKIGARDLPATVAYVFTKAKRKGNAELADIGEEQVKLWNRYGKHDDAGALLKLPDGTVDFADRESFDKDWNALLSEPVTLSGVRPVAIHELQNVAVTPDELYSLGPFVLEDQEAGALNKPQLV